MTKEMVFQGKQDHKHTSFVFRLVGGNWTFNSRLTHWSSKWGCEMRTMGNTHMIKHLLTSQFQSRPVEQKGFFDHTITVQEVLQYSPMMQGVQFIKQYNQHRAACFTGGFVAQKGKARPFKQLQRSSWKNPNVGPQVMILKFL